MRAADSAAPEFMTCTSAVDVCLCAGAFSEQGPGCSQGVSIPSLQS